MSETVPGWEVKQVREAPDGDGVIVLLQSHATEIPIKINDKALVKIAKALVRALER